MLWQTMPSLMAEYDLITRNRGLLNSKITFVFKSAPNVVFCKIEQNRDEEIQHL